VGNITAGGTGKSPLVAHIAAMLLADGRRPAVVTRGYGRSTRGTFVVSDAKGNIASTAESGDEPAMIAHRLEKLVVIADEVRIRGCAYAVREFGVDCIVLDDAFQHRHCHRDLDIVTIDTLAPLFDDRLLPAGRLREPLSNLSRAHELVLTRCNQTGNWEELAERLRERFAVPVSATEYVPAGIRCSGSEELLDAACLSGARVVAFCGIGSPASFSHTLQDLGVRVVKQIDFPDHHAYGSSDVEVLISEYRKAGADAFVTTEKDAVRLMLYKEMFEGLRLCRPEMEVRMMDGEGLDEAVKSVTGGVVTTKKVKR
jgi:tetraacyldisaccharide 4'-kinase